MTKCFRVDCTVEVTEEEVWKYLMDEEGYNILQLQECGYTPTLEDWRRTAKYKSQHSNVLVHSSISILEDI